MKSMAILLVFALFVLACAPVGYGQGWQKIGSRIEKWIANYQPKPPRRPPSLKKIKGWFKKDEPCHSCGGQWCIVCPQCYGAGQVMQFYGYQVYYVACPVCQGGGRLYCQRCYGTGKEP